MGDQGKSVLVVDDDDQLRDTIHDVLGAEGWKVSSARTGGDGLVDLIQRAELPSIILLDLNTPGLDGRGFLRMRSLNPRMAEIPVIVITGAREDIPDVPNGTVLKKPFDVDVLVGWVGKLAR